MDHMIHDSGMDEDQEVYLDSIRALEKQTYKKRPKLHNRKKDLYKNCAKNQPRAILR